VVESSSEEEASTLGNRKGVWSKGLPTARESPIAKRSRSELDLYRLSMHFFNGKDIVTSQTEAYSFP
jgi:hypothetical protein